MREAFGGLVNTGQFVKQGESGLGCSCLGGWCRCKKASCRRGGRDAVNPASFRPWLHELILRKTHFKAREPSSDFYFVLGDPRGRLVAGVGSAPRQVSSCFLFPPCSRKWKLSTSVLRMDEGRGCGDTEQLKGRKERFRRRRRHWLVNQC